MLQIPTELKIGAHIFKVKMVHGREELSGDEAGCVDSVKMTLALDATLPETKLESTFFHELFHCINSEIDHVLLDSFAEQLYQIFKDNGLLNEGSQKVRPHRL